ncbi:MAG: hypothetical protein R2713_23225 [Ilumatobacteraceae bacterium]
MLDEDSGRFIGPPTVEVVAQQHTLAELRSFLPGGPLGFVAHERAMRGEAVDADGLVDVLDLPFALQPWGTSTWLPPMARRRGRRRHHRGRRPSGSG